MTKHRMMLFAVVSVAVLVYANSIWNGFAYDDNWIIQRNPRVHDLGDLAGIWLTPYWPNFGSELGLYRPLTIFLFAIQWALGGGAAWAFHLVNVLLHAAVCVLVFRLIERLFSEDAAFGGAMIFAVHPLHTEAVANVVGQSELLAALGVLAACLIYVRRPDGPAIDWRRRIALFVIYGVSLLAKESAVVLPGLLVLLDCAQRRVQLNRESMKAYFNAVAFVFAMFCIILGAYLTLRLTVLGNITGTDAAPGLPYLREQYRVLNAFRAWPEFVRLLFFPLDLVIDYAPGITFPVESVTPMVGLGMLLAGITFILMFTTPWRPRAGLVTGWFFLTILPVSNFLFPIGVLIAERTLYLPSIAVAFLAGFAWEAAMKSTVRETRRLAVAAALAITMLLGVRTIIRNPDWDSLAAVWKALLRDHPEAYRAQWVNGSTMWSNGRIDLAEKYFQLAEKIWARDSQMLTEIANFYLGKRDFDKAIHYLERSRDMTGFVPRTYEFLGYAYLYGNRPQDAVATIIHAHGMGGVHKALTYAVLAGAYDDLGRYGDAAGAWRASAKARNGDIWLTYAMQARSLARDGRNQDALAAADLAVTRARNQPSILAVISKLKAAIADGCYPDGQDCDPLQGWMITSGASVTRPANSK